MLNPSPEWTPEERVSVVISITKEMREEVAKGIPSRLWIVECAQRIEFVLSKPSGFLEDNRDKILKG
jgi:hypothetical protein